MSKAKILVVYPDPESLDKVIEKANFQNSKNGPFEAVLMLGANIPSIPLKVKPEVPTYFCGELHDEAKLVDVGENFICVKKSWAKVKLQSGITLGFLNKAGTKEVPSQVDILVSYYWAFGVARTQQLTLVGNRNVDEVVVASRPRYHFAVGTEQGRFFENPMFAWTKTRSCRFISLGQEGSGNKWFYAFAIDHSDDDTSKAATNPFSAKRSRDESVEFEGAEIADNGADGNQSLDKLTSINALEDRPTKRAKIVAPSDCYFCLSNPKLEAHMIIAIGSHSYVTIAKGPLLRPDKSRDFSGHAIIIPIDHGPTLGSPVRESAAFNEITQFSTALAKAFLSASHATIFFEISRPENVHFHVQMVPVPLENAQSTFENALADRTKYNNERFERNLQLKFIKFDEEDENYWALLDAGNYLKFSVHLDRKVVHYIAQLFGNKSLDLQFPRRVLAFHLRSPKRISWEKCRQSVAQETADCEKFKKFFKSYDFSQ